jgi:hypothetical protein
VPSIQERITLYSYQTGLVASLRAQPLKANGTTTGSLITTGFTSMGGANYLFSGTVPSDTACVRYELSTDPGVAVAVGDTIESLTNTGGGGGSAGTQLIAMPTKLVAEGQVCPTDRLAMITLQSGSSLAYGVQMVDSIGNGVPTGGTTLSAKIKDETGTLLSGLTVEEVLASEGRVTVLIDTRVSELADITYATLEVTRDNGDSDITTYPAQLFIER